jgi:hypothetical protein
MTDFVDLREAQLVAAHGRRGRGAMRLRLPSRRTSGALLLATTAAAATVVLVVALASPGSRPAGAPRGGGRRAHRPASDDPARAGSRPGHAEDAGAAPAHGDEDHALACAAPGRDGDARAARAHRDGAPPDRAAAGPGGAGAHAVAPPRHADRARRVLRHVRVAPAAHEACVVR